jgi:hypothetical protein
MWQKSGNKSLSKKIEEITDSTQAPHASSENSITITYNINRKVLSLVIF